MAVKGTPSGVLFDFGRKLVSKRKKVGIWTDKKLFPLLLFICHVNIGGVKYGKKIKISINKKYICRQWYSKYSDVFKNLNSSQINLFIFLCCLAKQQYDVEKDDETEDKKTGWSDEIKINMIDFCKICGKKQIGLICQKRRKMQYWTVLGTYKNSNLHFINQKEGHYQMVLKVIIIFRMWYIRTMYWQ